MILKQADEKMERTGVTKELEFLRLKNNWDIVNKIFNGEISIKDIGNLGLNAKEKFEISLMLRELRDIINVLQEDINKKGKLLEKELVDD